MSVSTAVSRVTGFIRIGAMAYAVGRTTFSAAYVASNNIPNMIYELVAGGVLSAMFIPIFLEQMQKEGDDSASYLASSVFNLAMVALGLVALFATFVPQPFVWTQYVLGAKPGQFEDAVFLFRFFAIQIVFYGAAIIMTGMLNAKRHFLAPALGPVFNNVVVIATLVAYPAVLAAAGPTWAHVELAVGTTLGVVAQMATCIPPLLKLGFKYFPRIDTKMPAMRKMGRKMIPLVAYVAVNLIGVSMRNSIATKASGDAVATLNYAWVFYQLPYGIFAVALATAVFPEISEHANRSDWKAYREQFSSGIRANAVLILPAAAMLFALATPLITLWAVLHGAFRYSDVPITASVLRAWALGLFSFTCYMFSVRGFYSLQDTRTPAMTNTVLTLTVQIGLYAVLTLGVLGWAGIGVVGIPLADGIFYTVHFLVLILLLRGRIGGLDLGPFARSVGLMLMASAVGAFVAWGIVQVTPQLAIGFAPVVAQLLLGGLAGLAVTFGLARLFRVRELETAERMARGFFARLVGRAA